ncbi:serine hydrolase domain-containing protein [Gimibacter soli]|uniref:Serine hydrolase n=1 Tax=Gimibacter soli TaxID=3024400 RepID=A0AAE9XQ77_9PROT|nr:serine hydrolase domain-containing protein [Gimibacter soli]WCL52915.1 serine hydrolase [Gimibacter soli]
MKRFLLGSVKTLAALALWCVAVFFAFSEGWLRSPVTGSPEPSAFLDASKGMVAEANPGSFAMILIEDGEIAGSQYVSRGAEVGPESRFQVASLSKWVTAWGVMKLVQDGRIDLDAPVSTYLTRWQLPDGPFDENGVTVRRLLSHTAGLGDGLGYQGFGDGEAVQTLEESLTRAADASPNAEGSTAVTAPPGEAWKYSGGGYTLLQLVIEEVTGQSFAAYMQQAVFAPLGMVDTSFDHDEASRGALAGNYALDGSAEPFRRYTAMAAAALFTSAGDMARFAMAQAPGAVNPVLDDAHRTSMRQPHGRSLGADIWGLGAMLYAPNGNGDFIVGHDGNNEPAINTAVRLDPATGDGIVVLETGAPILATRVAGEWIFWKTGNIDFLLFSMMIGTMLNWIMAGSVIIVIIALVRAWRGRRRG